ncbi:MAG: TRAP transporter small permease subunit [Myxococcota bacterium]
MEKLKRLDNLVYQLERMVVVSALLVMAIVVFLDVVHRGFAGEASKFAEVGIKVAGLFGSLPAEDAPEYATAVAEMTTKLAAASPYVLFTLFTGLGYFGIRSAKRAEPVPPPIAALYAVAGVLATYGLIRLLIWGLPNGLIWSQPMALVLTLWVGFIGASMCTHDGKHLKVEALQRQIPDKYKPAVAFVSSLMTTLFCLVLLWLSLRYVRFNYDQFIQTEGRGGMFKGWDVPKYQGFAALPVAFTFMSVRFGARAVRALQGKIETVDALGLDKIKGDAPALPSDVETEAVRAESAAKRKPPGKGLAPSEVDTMTSQASGPGAVTPQSKVSTDPHQMARRAAAEADPEASPPTRGEEPKPAAGRISDSRDDLKQGSLDERKLERAAHKVSVGEDADSDSESESEPDAESKSDSEEGSS